MFLIDIIFAAAGEAGAGEDKSGFDAAYYRFFWAFITLLLILIIQGYTPVQRG
ncbi:MAG: hypothetical protein R6U43_06510 [Candidatus Krumholzibacteriales bacterium]